MGSGGAFGSAPSFGSSGAPGFLSPFDTGAVNAALGEATQAMTNRYGQLGLGQTGASPSGPTTGATPGIPGSGTTPVNPGSMGAGSTAEQMDLGTAPSLTGGLPAEAQAALGQIQTQDLSQTSSSANSAIQGKSQQVSGITSLASGLGGFL